MTGPSVRAVLREPLLHFFVVGALIFGVHAWMARRAAPSADTATRVVRIMADHRQQQGSRAAVHAGDEEVRELPVADLFRAGPEVFRLAAV